MSEETQPAAAPDGGGKKSLATRDGAGRFVAGVSGNPGGRAPIDIELRTLARAHTAEAIQALASIMLDEKLPGRVRVLAAAEILDRGWGRAVPVEAHPLVNINVGNTPSPLAGRELTPAEAYAFFINGHLPSEDAQRVFRKAIDDAEAAKRLGASQAITIEVDTEGGQTSAAPGAPESARERGEVIDADRDQGADQGRE